MENKLVHVNLHLDQDCLPLSLLTCLLWGLVLYCHCVACFRICFMHKFEEGVTFVQLLFRDYTIVNTIEDERSSTRNM